MRAWPCTAWEGHPAAGLLVAWVVDPDNYGNLLPLGCIGELLLEGPLIFQGYLNDPGKTAAAFFEDPAWLLQEAPGRLGRYGRLYKTSDLVRYNKDGSLTFIGRKDAQVKIRGQRVELGEVEYRVQECLPQARQVVVEVIMPLGENQSLVLAAFAKINYNVTETNEAESTMANILLITADVEDKLAKHLPRYMVPTVFFSMRELPMTVTGKINRRRLCEIGGSFSVQQLAEMQTAGQDKKRQPKSEEEWQTQRIWGQVLNINPTTIELDDSFFRLGGDSIAAMKLVSEAQKIGVKLAMTNIFRHPRLEHVAHQGLGLADDLLEYIIPFSLLGNSFDITLLIQNISIQCQLDPATIEDAYPYTPLQGGLLSLSSKRSGDYIMQSTLELSSDSTIGAFYNTWKEVAGTMEILRTRIVQHNDIGLLQVVLDEDIHWIEATGLNEYLQADRKESMEIGQPLARYALVKDDIGIYKWFVCTVQHAIYDGWSLPLIMNAVNRVYCGEALESRPQFKTFIKYIDEQDDKKVVDYWQQVLADCNCTPFPALPPSVQQPVADIVIEHQFLLPQRQSLDITTLTLIRAAWALVTSHMTDSDDVLFGVTVSGRNAPVVGIDEMAGPTIATAPVRIKVASNQRVSEYLEAEQRQAIDMIPFEQTGWHQIAKTGPDSK